MCLRCPPLPLHPKRESSTTRLTYTRCLLVETNTIDKNLIMFWKKQTKAINSEIDVDYAVEVVSKVGGIYAEMSESRHLIKSQSDLPCSWFSVRECFFASYKNCYQSMPKEIKDSCSHVYKELAFFVDGDLYKIYKKSFKDSIDCIIREQKEMGVNYDRKTIRSLYFSTPLMLGKRGDDLLAYLSNRCKTCSEKDILIITEVLTYCAELRQAMHQEWIGFINIIPIQQGFGDKR